jgi:Holliday junction resolvase RusA-like endonuclease
VSIYVLIPGEPCAQGRPRMAVVGGHARAFDPAKSRSWKGAARVAMEAARQTPILDGPIAVELLFVHSCPRTDYRKREPMPRRWRDKQPDAENCVKAALDAATGILWRDDAQIARLVVNQVTGAQDESPRVEMWARSLMSEPTVQDALDAIGGTIEEVRQS